MSVQDALSFLAKAGEDEALQQKISGAGASGWDKVAQSAGFNASSEDLKAASNQIMQHAKKSGNLSDDDLNKVVGGAMLAATQVSMQGLNFNLTRLAKLDAFTVAAW